MWPFKRKDKVIVQDNPKELNRTNWLLSDHFRGYKRCYLATHYGSYESNFFNLSRKYEKTGFKDVQASFVEYLKDNTTHYIVLFVDGLPVGTIFSDHEYFETIRTAQFYGFYIKAEGGEIKAFIKLD